MKYTVRIERQQDLISVVCDGDLIWSSIGIDAKRASISKHVRNFNKYPTNKRCRKTGFDKGVSAGKGQGSVVV